MTLEYRAKLYATAMHRLVNQTYDGVRPYAFHLQMAVEVARHFINLIPEADRDLVLAACWAHDVIEDTRESYSDVVKELGSDVAEIVYAVTNDKGRNRAERGGVNYYLGISRTKYAPFVKLCDRLANVVYSKYKGSRQYEMYRREAKDFLIRIYNPAYMDMMMALTKLC